VKLANNPGFGADTMLLLTDGTVMCRSVDGDRDPNPVGAISRGPNSAEAASLDGPQ